MDQYTVTITGLTPLLMHADNLPFAETLKEWRHDPAHKKDSIAGDDRSPAWTWLGSIYHDRRHIGIPADNLMTTLREGGAKVPIGKGKETFKKSTQSGILVDREQWDLLLCGNIVAIGPIWDALIGEKDFAKHVAAAEAAGFELLVKRAKVSSTKHVRVRPMFRQWSCAGTLTVLDRELSGITRDVLQTILTQAGALCGLGDWRPSSPRASGSFGRFMAKVE